jgi:hypothetical protein
MDRMGCKTRQYLSSLIHKSAFAYFALPKRELIFWSRQSEGNVWLLLTEPEISCIIEHSMHKATQKTILLWYEFSVWESSIRKPAKSLTSCQVLKTCSTCHNCRHHSFTFVLKMYKVLTRIIGVLILFRMNYLYSLTILVWMTLFRFRNLLLLLY